MHCICTLDGSPSHPTAMSIDHRGVSGELQTIPCKDSNVKGVGKLWGLLTVFHEMIQNHLGILSVFFRLKGVHHV